MKQPPVAINPAPPDLEFILFSHVEIFNMQATSGLLTSRIPAQEQTGANPGPPFSFWGRGVLADWSLFTDASISSLDLSELSGVKLKIGCIGLVPQGVAVPTNIRTKPGFLTLQPQPLLTPSKTRVEKISAA